MNAMKEISIKPTKWLAITFVLLSVLLAACGLDGQGVAGNGEQAAGCPSAEDGAAAYANDDHGYCLLYPANYIVEQPNADETVFVIDSIMNHTDPRASITVVPANGRTAAQAADEMLEGLDMDAFNIERAETSLGGEAAIMLDSMPGQDINRQLFAVHGGMLFHLYFTPFDTSLGENYARAENLYNRVTASFVFQS
jgi:hypothetical protein